jgi:glycosyltransferase involved in cell wall biosynthesis
MTEHRRKDHMSGPAAHRLVVVVPWLQGGGAQAALRETMRRLEATDAVLVVCFDDNRNTASLEAEFREVHLLRGRKSAHGAWKASRWLSAFLEPGDVVFSLMRGSHVVLGMLPVRQLRSLKVVASFHQLPSVDAQGRLSFLENMLVRRAVSRAELVTSPSTRGLRELRARKLIRPGAGVVSPNLIEECARPLVPPRTGPLGELRLLLAGRLDHQKGIDRIEDLLSGSPIPIRLLVAGEGPLRPVVERLVAKPGRLVVDYRGHVDDVFELIDSVDFLFLPSRYELNPVVVWEAWARGRAAITSDVAAFQDLAESGPLRTFHDRDSLHALLLQAAAADSPERDGLLDTPDVSVADNPLLLELQGLLAHE